MHTRLSTIKQGTSTCMCDDVALQQWLAGLLGVKFEGILATADRLWLRKEIMRRAIKKEGERNEDHKI